MRTAIKRNQVSLVKLKRAEVWIERRYTGGIRRDLMARMVEWTGDELEQVPIWGRCLLTPNRVYDVEMAKRLVRRYLEGVTDQIEFVVRV